MLRRRVQYNSPVSNEVICGGQQVVLYADARQVVDDLG